MTTDPAPVRSVARALDIVMALARQGPASVTRVCALTGLTKGTVHRMLQSLGHAQVVVQDPTSGEYLLGPGCLAIADAVSRGAGGLGMVARPVLEQLRDVTQETVTLHVRVGAQRVCVEELPSPLPVRYTAGVGSTAAAHTGSAGKLLLAFLLDDVRSRIVDQLTLEAVTERTVTDLQALETELAGIRERGYATSRGERVLGAAAISAPVRDASGSVLAALSLLGPEGRLTDRRIDELRPTVLEAAEEVSARLGAGSERDADEINEEVAG